MLIQLQKYSVELFRLQILLVIQKILERIFQDNLWFILLGLQEGQDVVEIRRTPFCFVLVLCFRLLALE